MKKGYLVILLVYSAFLVWLASLYFTSGTPDEEVAPEKTENLVINNILTRTSIRKFTSEPIQKDTIELLLRAGMAAPTGVNKQPWKFVVVTDRALLDTIGNNFKNASMIHEAPLAIIPCGDQNNMLEGQLHDLWLQDCCAAAENILLAAHGLDLGGVWTWVYPTAEKVDKVREMLSLEPSLVPVCVIVLGHPAESPEPKDKWKPENVIWK